MTKYLSRRKFIKRCGQFGAGVAASFSFPSFKSLAKINFEQVELAVVQGNPAGAVAKALDLIGGIKKMHAEGKGIIGMKLIGNGDFKDPQVRRKSIEFVMGLDCVDASVIGFKSPEEIDEAIENINRALKA